MINKSIKVIKDVNQKGFFHLFSANTLIHLIEFASQLFIAWLLVAEDIGRIKSFQVYAAIAVIFAGLGFNTSVLKLCSEKKGKEEKQHLFITAFVYTLMASFFTLIVFLIVAKLNLLSVDNRTNELFVFYAFTIPIIALNNLLISYFQALKEFKKVSIYLVFARIVHVILIISLTYFYQIEGFIGGVVVGFLFSLLLLLTKTNVRITYKSVSIENFKHHWQVAKYAFLSNAISNVNLYLDYIILNHFIKDGNLMGQYGFALTLMAGLRVFGFTVQQFVTPFYSESSNEINKLQKMFKKSERIFISISLIVGVFSVIILPFFIEIIFSGKYNESMHFFLYLTLAWVMRSWYALKGPLLLSLGFVKVNFYNSLLLFALSVIPYWILIKQQGLMGAVYAQCLTAIMGAIIVSVSLNKVLTKKRI